MPHFHPQHLAEWARARWTIPPTGPVLGIGQDTRKLKSGDLYVAIRGNRYDGHAFLDAARDAGAVAALVDETFAAQAVSTMPLLVVPDTRQGLTAMAAGYLSCLDLTRVGVSGSAGKTTVKELTADMLAPAAPTIRNPGNWNNDIGLPLALLRIEETHRFGVFELGINHPGEMAELCDCLRPDAAILTEIGPVHIEYFSCQQEIAQEKALLFARLHPDAPAVVSRENAWFQVIQSRTAGRLVTTSFSEDADYRGGRGQDGMFTVTEGSTGETCQLVAPLPGDYFTEDALLAVAMARQMGAAWEAIASAVAEYAPPPMRWNRESIAERILIDDSYNANPISMQAALQAFAQEPANRRWLVLGGMLELGDHGERLHRELGVAAAAGSWAGLLAFGSWGKQIAEGAGNAGMSAGQIHVLETHADMVDILIQETRPGDAILIKASRGEQLNQITDEWKRRLTLQHIGT